MSAHEVIAWAMLTGVVVLAALYIYIIWKMNGPFK